MALFEKIILLLTIFSLNSWAMSDPDLKPFATDYCTLYVEGTHQQPNLWRHCCVEHDLYFWAGGSLDDKKATDLNLLNLWLFYFYFIIRKKT